MNIYDKIISTVTSSLILSTMAFSINAEQSVLNISEKSFTNIRKMTPVRHFYVDNLLGNIDDTLAAANAP
ncbi:hypothetical protein [Shewanella glacialimarina]|uniref:hypothetical protein n=1 Tax=Shewanella glacialimarina TaxID=2590884 RepID=UPI001CF829A3|nr:hypothetical protein [Shewanella glacialimarina]UCX04336.1 hypothetical protein FJ709_07375 [Shewanella glacialimarina]